MTALWRGEVEMRWNGDRLMLGNLYIGWVGCHHGEWFWSLGARDTESDFPDSCTESEARSALVTAAVRALGKDAPA